MKFKKILAGLLSVTILSFAAAPAFAANTEDFVEQVNEQTYFKAFTGVVKKITEHDGVVDSKFVLLENEEGVEANIIVSAETYILNNAKIEVGSVVTGLYDASAPMIMIYPAQYSAKVVVVESKDQNPMMVPLRAIAEALGLDVSWNSESQRIMIGKEFSLKVGEDNYLYMNTTPVQLGAAPTLVDGTTLVPLSFFKEVVPMNK